MALYRLNFLQSIIIIIHLCLHIEDKYFYYSSKTLYHEIVNNSHRLKQLCLYFVSNKFKK